MLTITTTRISGSAQDGWFMAYSPWGAPILARPTAEEAYRDACQFLRNNPEPQMKVCGARVKDV
jgi:hypothetical protein